MLVSAVLMGFLVPIVANVGPTREALAKNLRTSLDASRRDGSGDQVTVFVQKLQDVGLSWNQIITGLYLCAFGMVTYYFIPMSVLTQNRDLFFFILNLIMLSLLLGLVFIVSIILPWC